MRLTDIRDALMTDGTAVGVPGNRHLALYADDVHLWISGQTWPLAGHHTGRAALQVLMQAHDRIWPGGTHFSGNEYW